MKGRRNTSRYSDFSSQLPSSCYRLYSHDKPDRWAILPVKHRNHCRWEYKALWQWPHKDFMGCHQSADARRQRWKALRGGHDLPEDLQSCLAHITRFIAYGGCQTWWDVLILSVHCWTVWTSFSQAPQNKAPWRPSPDKTEKQQTR